MVTVDVVLGAVVIALVEPVDVVVPQGLVLVAVQLGMLAKLPCAELTVEDHSTSLHAHVAGARA